MAGDEKAQNYSEPSENEGFTTQPVPNFQVMRSDTFVEVYANYASFAVSACDMTLMFGRTVADDPRNPRLEQRASVSVSLHTAKVLTHRLLQHIERYEQQYGEIRLMPKEETR